MTKYKVEIRDIFTGEIKAESEQEAIRKIQERKSLILAGEDKDIHFEQTEYKINKEE